MIERSNSPWALNRRPIPVGDLAGVDLNLDRFGGVFVRNSGSDSATVSRVAASTSAVTLAAVSGPTYASLGARTGVSIYNDSAADLYVKLGTGASTTDFTVKIPPDGLYETPYGLFGTTITGVWTSAVGAAQVTIFERDF
jgi:hypothetical protein